MSYVTLNYESTFSCIHGGREKKGSHEVSSLICSCIFYWKGVERSDLLRGSSITDDCFSILPVKDRRRGASRDRAQEYIVKFQGSMN